MDNVKDKLNESSHTWQINFIKTAMHETDAGMNWSHTRSEMRSDMPSLWSALQSCLTFAADAFQSLCLIHLEKTLENVWDLTHRWLVCMLNRSEGLSWYQNICSQHYYCEICHFKRHSKIEEGNKHYFKKVKY